MPFEYNGEIQVGMQNITQQIWHIYLRESNISESYLVGGFMHSLQAPFADNQ